MKKSLLILGALVALAFGAVTVLKHRGAEGTAAASGPNAAEAERVKEFWALYNRGNALRAQGEYAQAADAFRKALEFDPQHEDSLYYLGTSLYETGDYPQAAAELRKIVAANPASGRAWSELGNTLAVQAPGAPQDFREAQSAFERAAELNREQAGPFLRLGLLNLNQGKPDPATDNFRLAAGFGSPEGGYLLAYTQFLYGRDQDVLPPLRGILHAYSRDKNITGRGVLSEGDILPGPGKPLTALDRSALKSILLLGWESRRLGGYPKDIAAQFRIPQRPDMTPSFRSLGKKSSGAPAGGRGAWADFDRSGRPSLIVAGPGRPVALYRHRGGEFEDVTAAAGLAHIRDVWEPVWVDYDADGYPDLYLIRSGYTGSGQNLLFHNNRNGTFTETTAKAGLQGKRPTARACFADFFGSGRPDLLEVGPADGAHSSVRLYRNTGAGFVETDRQAGLVSSVTAVDCAAADYDRDGRQDLFVLNWKHDAVLYHNDGAGKFSDATTRAGLAALHVTSFSALFLDYDNDGWPDLLVSAQAPFEEAARCLLQPGFAATRGTPRLFHNLKNGRFEDVTRAMGLGRCYGTVQALAADLDRDGWTDLLLINGSLDAERLEPTVVLHNLQGQGFKEWFYLPGFDSPSNFSGAAVGDIGADGRFDLYLARNPLLPSSVAISGAFSVRGPSGQLKVAGRNANPVPQH